MKKIIYILFFYVLVVQCTFAQNFNIISKEIRKIQSNNPSDINWYSKYFINQYFYFRKITKCFDMINSDKRDTIYLLERHSDGQDLVIRSTIWNSNNILSYQSEDGKTVTFVFAPIFSSYMIKLATEWNISEIRKEELKNFKIPIEIIYLTRIIIDREKYKIECLYFRNFFNLQRDQFQ